MKLVFDRAKFWRAHLAYSIISGITEITDENDTELELALSRRTRKNAPCWWEQKRKPRTRSASGKRLRKAAAYK
jgi:hypothetical protein